MCDKSIHDELIDMVEFECPYCNEVLIKCDTSPDVCCENHNIFDIDGIRVCILCGLVHSTISKDDYIDFYENIFKIKRKSIYNRKYHIINIMNNLLIDKGVELTYNQRNKIYRIFDKIGYILPQINGNRKRMICTNFIMKKIFDMMDIKYDIPISQSSRTLAFYNKYWMQIMALIGDKIEAIIVK